MTVAVFFGRNLYGTFSSHDAAWEHIVKKRTMITPRIVPINRGPVARVWRGAARSLEDHFKASPEFQL